MYDPDDPIYKSPVNGDEPITDYIPHPGIELPKRDPNQPWWDDFFFGAVDENGNPILYTGTPPDYGGKGIIRKALLSCSKRNASKGIRILLKNGFYEVPDLKISKRYYERLWREGRPAPFIVARKILESGVKGVPDKIKPGFLRYQFGGWEMVYNPITKEVWHLQPIKKVKYGLH